MKSPCPPSKTVVKYLFCSLSTPSGIHAACVLQFPDPHFKMKHKKRRVIQPELVHALAHLMPPGGACFLRPWLHIKRDYINLLALNQTGHLDDCSSTLLQHDASAARRFCSKPMPAQLQGTSSCSRTSRRQRCPCMKHSGSTGVQRSAQTRALSCSAGRACQQLSPAERPAAAAQRTGSMHRALAYPAAWARP